MSDFMHTVVSEVTDNFDNIRVPLSSKQREKIAKIYPYYGAQSIIDYVDDYLFDGEYILVAEDGENLRSQNSNVCNLVKGKFWVNNHAHIIRAKEGYSSKYLYYFLNLIDFKPFITGSAQPKLTKDNLNQIPLKIHSGHVQKKIAKVLSELDAKIDLNNKINTELEQMAKLIYDYWFVQFDFPMSKEQAEALGKPELVGQPYKASGGKMVFNEELKREIPEGWGCEPLDKNIVLFDSKRIPLSKSKREEIPGDIPYYGATGIMGYVNDYIFNDEYILMAEDGSVMNAEGMPIIQFIWGKTWVNNHAHVLQSKQKEHNEFYYQLLKMIPVVMIKTGSIQMKINQENLKKYKVISPPKDLIESFSEQADTIRKKLIINIEQNQKIAELRDWLLPMLMNGQVIVKSADLSAGME